MSCKFLQRSFAGPRFCLQHRRRYNPAIQNPISTFDSSLSLAFGGAIEGGIWILVSNSLLLDKDRDLQIAEALAILKGISLAADKGFVPAVLESDALTVVNAIVSKEAPALEVGVAVQDILDLLLNVNVSLISFVPRLANKVEHSLAELALNYVGEYVWLDDCPIYVQSLILGDCPNSS